MKASNLLTLTLAIAAMMLQGCAETGTTRANTAEPVAPVQAASATTGSSESSANIPEANGKPVVVADNKANFDLVAAAIRQEMQPGGRFGSVNDTGRQTVENRLADMRTLFDQYGSVDKMQGLAQTKLLADQNAVNEVLARNDGNRRICWKETPVGTHFPTTVCRTLAEIQGQRQNARDKLDQNRQLIQQENQIKYSPAPGGGH
ncbi:MAG TPA: hypothetical protein VJN66_03815 [Rhodanobacteraceae bacterium]|nr:hypothetical protein [Rhodanobacteraceae bacterium]